MKTISTARRECEDRSFGSSFDPLLNGVAQGLAQLFPPVEPPRRRDDEGDRVRPRGDGQDWDEE